MLKLHYSTYKQSLNETLSWDLLVPLYLLYTGEMSSAEDFPEQTRHSLILRNALQDNHLSSSGINLLLPYLTSSTPGKYSESFEKFWKTYPVSDKWDRFPETRKLRGDKLQTYIAYADAIKKVTPEFLQSSLETDLKNKKEGTTLKNPLEYMKQAKNWLLTEEYLNVSLDDSVQEDDILL